MMKLVTTIFLIICFGTITAMEQDGCILPLEIQYEVTKYFVHDHLLKDKLKKYCCHIVEGYNDWVCYIAYSPDGNHVVAGLENKKAIIWDIKSGKNERVLQGHKGWVCCVVYSPDGNHILTGSVDKKAIIWNAISGKKEHVLRGHNNAICCLAYSPDGNHVVTGSDQAIIWNVASGRKEQILEHDDVVRCLAYSPDGNHIVTGSDEAIIWNVASGRKEKTLRGHNGWVRCVMYTSDGNYIVTGSEDKKLIAWDAGGGELRDVLQKEEGDWILCTLYSSNGNRIMGLQAKKMITRNSLGLQEIDRFFERGVSVKLMLMLDLLCLAIEKNKKLFIHKKEMPVFKELPEVAQRILKGYIRTERDKSCIIM